MSSTGFIEAVSTGALDDGYTERIVYGPPRFPNSPGWDELQHYAAAWESVPCTDPSILTALATGTHVIRVTFDRAVLNNAALRNPRNYTFDPPLTAVLITPEAVANPTYVDVTLSTEMIQGQAYDLDIEVIEALNLACNADLEVTSAVALTSTTLRITFSDDIESNPAVEDPVHYEIDPALTVFAAAVVAANQVDLLVSEMLDGGAYDVEVLTIEAAP